MKQKIHPSLHLDGLNAHESAVFSLPFNPLPGMSSPHIQTVLACFTPGGTPPPSTSKVVRLKDGDALCCEVSTPPQWKNTDQTIILIHGLGGSHTASYMVRLSRKLYYAGYRAIRVNMRSCGSGKGLTKLPYHGGLSSDVLAVIHELKSEAPLSSITIIGYSLGGNIALKLAAELGEASSNVVHSTIAVCPPIDLAETACIMARPINHLYNRYYMHHVDKLAREWTQGRPFSTIYEYDKIVTAPRWGFASPSDYYQKSSSCFLLEKIRHPCRILFAADDPFINYRTGIKVKKSAAVKVWISKHGGHMGFFGWAGKEHGYHWIDQLLLEWLR